MMSSELCSCERKVQKRGSGCTLTISSVRHCKALSLGALVGSYHVAWPKFQYRASAVVAPAMVELEFHASVQCLATKRVLQENSLWTSRATWAFTFIEVLSLLPLGVACFVSTPWLGGFYGMILYPVAAIRARSLLEPLLWPAQMIMPKDQSALGGLLKKDHVLCLPMSTT